MKSEYTVPRDLPAAACGRCVWNKPITSEGWGMCLIYRERRWYKCMVCPEYDQDPEPNLEV